MAKKRVMSNFYNLYKRKCYIDFFITSVVSSIYNTSLKVVILTWMDHTFYKYNHITIISKRIHAY